MISLDETRRVSDKADFKFNYPLARVASREVANLTERKNPHKGKIKGGCLVLLFV